MSCEATAACVRRVPIGAAVTLTPEEAARYAALGRERTANNVAAGRHRPLYSGRNPFAVDAMALQAEYAVCRLFGLEPARLADTQPWVKRLPEDQDRANDLVLGGLRVDVKCTDRAAGMLLVVNPDRPGGPPDLYCLVTTDGGDPPTFTLRGFARAGTATRRRASEYGVRMRRGDPFATRQGDLKTFEECVSDDTDGDGDGGGE